MAKVTTTLTQENPKAWVTVKQTVVRSPELKLKSRLGESPQGLILPDGSPRHYMGAETACFSGTFYALRKIGDEGYAVTIDAAFGEIATRDTTVCAIAIGVGLAYATGHPEFATEETLQGWRIAECQVTGSLSP